MGEQRQAAGIMATSEDDDGHGEFQQPRPRKPMLGISGSQWPVLSIQFVAPFDEIDELAR